MTLLAFDSSGGACSAAVLRGGRILAHQSRDMDRGHAEALLPMISEVLGACECGYEAVKTIAVTVGPGSFTGIRTGIAAARGLSLALSAPAIAVTTLEAVAWAGRIAGGTEGRPILTVLDTRRDDLYCQLFGGDLSPLSEPAALPPERAAALVPAGPVLVVGSASNTLRGLLDPGITRFADGVRHPDAKAVAMIAAGRNAAGPPQPLYLHPPQATVPLAGGRIRP